MNVTLPVSANPYLIVNELKTEGLAMKKTVDIIRKEKIVGENCSI